MDNPIASWKQGCDNFFEWPTSMVVGKLDGLNISDLGVLVRLEKPEPNKKEKIAPVVFYHSELPQNISEYSFIFQTNRDAKLKYSIRNERTREKVVVEKERYLRVKANKPFKISWNNVPITNCSYKLIIKGHFIGNSENIRQFVLFDHHVF